MKKLILFLIVGTFLSCSKDDKKSFDFLDCNEHTANYNNYNGEEIGCHFYYTLTEYNGQQFIELGAHCADLARPFVINENCEDICAEYQYDQNSPCGKYLSGREIIEIILIEN